MLYIAFIYSDIKSVGAASFVPKFWNQGAIEPIATSESATKKASKSKCKKRFAN